METVLRALESAVSRKCTTKCLWITECFMLGVIATSTCSSTISTNTTYIRNPNYPSSYTPSSTGSCVYTINKVSDDVCQLRLDFQTFSGFVDVSTTGVCTDYITLAGKTGKNQIGRAHV